MAEEGLLEKFFTPFYERVKNPFMGSFIISWLIVNWRIPYVTFFLDNKDVKLLDITKDTKIEYIQTFIDWPHFFCWPLFGAIMYVTVVQLLAFGFSWIMERVAQQQLSNKTKITEGIDAIPGKMYVELMQEYEKEKNTLPKYRQLVSKAEGEVMIIKNDLEVERDKYRLLSDSEIKLRELINEREKIIQQKDDKINELSEDNATIAQRINFINSLTDLANYYELTSISYDLLLRLMVSSPNTIEHKHNWETINSGGRSIFLGSTTYPLLAGYKAIVKKDVQPWNTIKNTLPEFEHSDWICHSISTTIKEAKEGGVYIYVVPINIISIDKLASIDFTIYADNYIEIFIGESNSLIGEHAFDLHEKIEPLRYTMDKAEIESFLTTGLNCILFKVRNQEMPEAKHPTDNPYGLIYNIRFKNNL